MWPSRYLKKFTASLKLHQTLNKGSGAKWVKSNPERFMGNPAWVNAKHCILTLHFRHTLSDFPLPPKPQNGVTSSPFMHNHYGGDSTTLPLPPGFWFLPVLPWKQCAVKNKISQTTGKSPATKQHNRSKTIPKTLISDLEKGTHILNSTFCSYTTNRFQTWRKRVFFNTKQLWWEVRMVTCNSQPPPPTQRIFPHLLISPVGLSGGIGFCGRTFFPFFFLPLRGGRVRAGGLVFLRGRFLTSAASSFCCCSCQTTTYRNTDQFLWLQMLPLFMDAPARQHSEVVISFFGFSQFFPFSH